MKVLVVGSGGREHALCWAIGKSPRCTALYCAPGNAGIAKIATLVPFDPNAMAALAEWAAAEAVDLAVIGPEAPLVAGLADLFAAAGIPVFGPSAAAAALEGSKGFMKDVLAANGVPTAAYGRFRRHDEAADFIRRRGAPIVIKTDGLAAGKGVVLCRTEDEALRALDAVMAEKVFGAAGDEVVIEEFLEGEELSFFALCDGTSAIPFGAAQDHKAVGDGDVGPNTGGMGAYSPPPLLTPALERTIMERCIQPTLDGMRALGRPFRGVLFCGLMIAADGVKVLEYNVRFGDPECQALMARYDGDVLDVLLAAAEGRLHEAKPRWKPEAALVVVMANAGYPGPLQGNSPIRGLERLETLEGVQAFHAATTWDKGDLRPAGGRVLGIAATGPSVAAAQKKAYQAVDCIDWPGGFCRRDIGWRAILREAAAKRQDRGHGVPPAPRIPF